ncbi:MAG: 1,2-phenylacetyl-CoA epoxidase, subunit A, partial [uncultured Frankineae bacterium]
GSGPDAEHGRARARVPGRRRRGRPHRAARLDARGLPPHAGAPDRPARALRDHRHAARGQLDHARAVAAPQVHPRRQGAGRGRPRALPLQRRRDARRRPRGAARPAAHRPPEVLHDLQLPDHVVGRRRGDRVARRRRRDHEPGAADPLLVRPLRARDGPGLQGGVLPPAAGLRGDERARPGHPGPAPDGAGRARPVVVALADDVRALRHRLAQQRALDGLGDQALQQRRAAPALRRRHRAAGRAPRADRARPRPAVRRGDRALRLRRDRLDRVRHRHARRRAVQPRAPGAPRRGARGRRLGPRGRGGLRRQAGRTRRPRGGV